MKKSLRTILIAVAAAGAVAALPAFALGQTTTSTASALSQAQNLITLQGPLNPAPTQSTAAVACPDTMRAATQMVGLNPFGGRLSATLVTIPTSAFASGNFGSDVRYATAQAQLAEVCERF